VKSDAQRRNPVSVGVDGCWLLFSSLFYELVKNPKGKTEKCLAAIVTDAENVNPAA
jgi:hypothetical protein